MYPNQTSKSFAAFFMASAKVSHADRRENTLLYHWGRFCLVPFSRKDLINKQKAATVIDPPLLLVCKNGTKQNRPQWYYFTESL